jgi:hypothetical protein
MLNISISIGDVESELITDQNLSFDAIESLLNRAVAATLQCYLSLPTEDRLASFGTDEEEDDDEEAE